MDNKQIKNVIDEQQAIQDNMNNEAFEKLVGLRFNSLTTLKKYMRKNLKLRVQILMFSESETIKECDFMIDGELTKNEAFTIFYLFDNNKNIFITEV